MASTKENTAPNPNFVIFVGSKGICIYIYMLSLYICTILYYIVLYCVILYCIILGIVQGDIFPDSLDEQAVSKLLNTKTIEHPCAFPSFHFIFHLRFVLIAELRYDG